MPRHLRSPRHRRLTGGGRPAILLAAFALLAALLIAGPAVVDAVTSGRTSPRTSVVEPTAGSRIAPDDLVDGRVMIRGTAQHRRGVASVELVVKQLETGRYWNGDGWQSRFVRFPVPVADDGAPTTSWSYGLDADGLEQGHYRARAFARSVDGNGDANGGHLVEFEWRPQLDRDLYDTHVLWPATGAMVAGPVTISGQARSTDGIAGVRAVLRTAAGDRYWDGESWTRHFTLLDATIDRVGADEVTWTLALPEDAPAGRYTVRAWARTSSGLHDPFGRGRSTFELTEAGPTTTTTPTSTSTTTRPGSTTTRPGSTSTSVATTVPTTGPSTTVRPTTTVQPTTTARPTTTIRPTTTARPTTTVRPTTTLDPCPEGDRSILVPCDGVLIGASGDFTNDDGSARSKQEHVQARERQLGTDFDIFHDFVQWNDLVGRTWPRPATAELAADGHILFTNWKSPTGHPRDWAAIANGRYDTDIVAAARQFATFGEATFLTFYHEPEDNIRDASGSDPAQVQRYIDDYRAAFRHLHDTFEAEGADNVIWVWDMQGWLGGFEDYYTSGLYPGDDVVDWVAWNPYNWYGCVNHGTPRKWKTFTEVVAPFYDWLDAGGPGRPGRDKPLMLGEFGSEENTGATNSSQTKAGWLDEARRVLPERFPRLRAVVYFDTEGRRSDGSVQFCRWGLDSSQASLDAMTRLLLDDDLRARW